MADSESLEIPLDEVILRLEPKITARRRGIICLVKGEIEFSSGKCVKMQARYDPGKQWIIDPLLQDPVLKQHVGIMDNYMLLDDSGRSLDPNYQKWRDYKAIVSRKVAELIENKKLKVNYRS